MENQVTSIEQSRRLLELGVPAEKASMRWGIYRDFGENSNRCKLLLSNQDVFSDYATYIPAFTVADLLGMLPTIISYKDRLYYLSVRISGYDCSVEYILHDCVEGVAYIGALNTMINSLFNAIEWLLENGINIKL